MRHDNARALTSDQCTTTTESLTRYGLLHRASQRWISTHPMFGPVLTSDESGNAVTFRAAWEADAWRETLGDFRDTFIVRELP